MAGVARIPNDIFQYSLHSAYSAGLTAAGPPATALTGYGSHGIGHVAAGSGSPGRDLLLLAGTPYLLLPDGSARRADGGRGANADDVSLAFVMVTLFAPQSRVASQGLRMGALREVLAGQGAERGGRNSLMPFRVAAARFARVELLAGHVLTGVPGSVFGFVVPAWATGISSPGPGEVVRCCFLEEGGRRGGFVEDFELEGEAQVEWAVTGRFHLGFPHGEEWQGVQLG